MKKSQLAETLQEIRFLHDVSPAHLEKLVKAASLRDFKQAAVVFREGDVAKCVYLVVTGKVSLEICAPGVGCKRILTVGPGELLGWSALLDETRLTATARTIEPTQLVELDADRLLALFDKNPRVGYEFTRRAMQAVSKRLSATRMQLVDVFGSQLPAVAYATED